MPTDDEKRELIAGKLRDAAKRAEYFQTGEAGLLSAAADALEVERGHMQSLAKWVGVSENAPSLEIVCEVSSVLEAVLAEAEWEYRAYNGIYAGEARTHERGARLALEERMEDWVFVLSDEEAAVVVERRVVGPWIEVPDV